MVRIKALGVLIGSSNQWLHKLASRYDRSDPPNKNRHIFLQSQITIYSVFISTKRQGAFRNAKKKIQKVTVRMISHNLGKWKFCNVGKTFNSFVTSRKFRAKTFLLPKKTFNNVIDS